MKCKDCAMFDNRKDTDGNYTCNLCSGTYVSPREKERKVCKYTGERITDEYASKKYWMLPFDCFDSKLHEVEAIIEFAQKALRTDNNLRQKLAGVLYSQLATALEVYLREQLRIGMESPKAFDNFVKSYFWKAKYYPHEIYGNIRQIVNAEAEKINFQNFSEAGKAYEVAFGINVFSFPRLLKREINRILRYRHSLIHKDEIWEDGRFIKVDFPQLEIDIKRTKDFVTRIQGSFEKNIGIASEIWTERVKLEQIKDERTIDNCKICPLGLKFSSKVIVCFEGAYDGIGFGMKPNEWENPACGGMTFLEAMRQRKSLGEKGLFGQLNLIPYDKENTDATQEKRSKKGE